jgi:GNAT superfamily N-acetyltransferase
MPRIRPPRANEAETLGIITRRATRASLPTAYVAHIARRATFPEGFEVDLDVPGWRWAVLPDAADRPVGYAAVELRRGTLAALYVDPAHQGQGHGRRLLSWAERTLRAQGHARLRTDAELPALPFYLRHGWRALAATTLDLDARGRLPVVRLVKTFG